MIGMIDIGGTNIKYGKINPESEEYELLGEIPTKANQKNFQMMDRLDRVIDILDESGDLKGIAISTAGIVEPVTGEIIFANKNIPNYKGTKLKELLEKKYEIPVAVENDVNSALLGELTFGPYEKVHSALMLTIGTGVGGALYLNGEIYHGFSNSAGEVGYSFMNGKNIEETASTTALVTRVKKRLKQEDIDGRWIFDQAINHQNPIAVAEIDALITELVYFINNFVSLLNPEYVILGGGIMEQEAYLRSRLTEKFRMINQNQLVVEKTKIEFASLGNQAGMLGAYTHFKNTCLSHKQ